MGKNGKIIILVVAFLITIVIAGLGGFFIGNCRNNNAKCNPVNCENNKLVTETFYAKIIDISTNFIRVEGLEVNDIDYRENFNLNVTNNTKFEWRDSEIKFNDLEIGDIIAITFSKNNLDVSNIKDTIEIKLLNDRLETKCLENVLGGYITNNASDPYEVNIKELIDIDTDNIQYSHIEINKSNDMYALIKTSDNQIISKFENYLQKNYNGYKRLQVYDYIVYVYNHISNEDIELDKDLKSCFKYYAN